MHIPRLQDVDLKGKSVILRTVLNVPVKDGIVTEEFRIDAAIPTIEYLLEQNCKVIIVGMMGRPDGKRLDEFSLKPVQTVLQAKLGKQITFVDDFTVSEQADKVPTGKAGEIFLLENIRFYPGEEAKDEETRTEFAKQIAALGEVYINDAFADYRAHASTFDIAKLMPMKAAGLQMITEIEALDRAIQNPTRPLVALIGGAKLSTKLDILTSLCEKADQVIIGGAMAYTFLQAQGHKTGSSLVEADKIDVAKEMLEKYGSKLHLPIDHIVANSFSESAAAQTVTGADIPENMWGMDIGPDTIDKYSAVIDQAGTILWNGPVGVFEWEKFATGTRTIGVKIADTKVFTLVGGGDTIAAVNLYDLEYGMDHICTGGGAMLEYIAKGTLDPITALRS